MLKNSMCNGSEPDFATIPCKGNHEERDRRRLKEMRKERRNTYYSNSHFCNIFLNYKLSCGINGLNQCTFPQGSLLISTTKRKKKCQVS